MGDLEGRLDVHFYLPEFQSLIKKIKAKKYRLLGEIARFSKETTSFSEFSDGIFEYLEIAGVEIGTNTYQTTLTNVVDAPSRARMKTQPGDIVISTTRPNRGAIAQIKDDKIIASTGFSIIRELDDSVDREWMLYTLLSDLSLQQMLQRSSGGNYPAIIEDEIKKIYIPCIDVASQKKIAQTFRAKLDERKRILEEANKALSICKDAVFASLKLYFLEYRPALYSISKLKDVRELGIYCNPHSDYLNDVFSKLRANNFFAGHLEDFVEINPKTSREDLQDKSAVSFVPMTAVTEKTNEVVYELKTYSEVKAGFTIFRKDDLLWAKITPCMQNGKSFVASDMPTDIGFGSTEFHVLRAKNSKRVYMPYLWVIFSNEHILEAAQGMFGGSAGQQRVPDTFLKKFPIVLPPYEVQVKLADQVFEALEKAKKMRAKAEYDWQNARKQFEKELLGE